MQSFRNRLLLAILLIGGMLASSCSMAPTIRLTNHSELPITIVMAGEDTPLSMTVAVIGAGETDDIQYRGFLSRFRVTNGQKVWEYAPSKEQVDAIAEAQLALSLTGESAAYPDRFEADFQADGIIRTTTGIDVGPVQTFDLSEKGGTETGCWIGGVVVSGSAHDVKPNGLECIAFSLPVYLRLAVGCGVEGALDVVLSTVGIAALMPLWLDDWAGNWAERAGELYQDCRWLWFAGFAIAPHSVNHESIPLFSPSGFPPPTPSQ